MSIDEKAIDTLCAGKDITFRTGVERIIQQYEAAKAPSTGQPDENTLDEITHRIATQAEKDAGRGFLGPQPSGYAIAKHSARMTLRRYPEREAVTQVRFPQNVEEAQAMALLGVNYLEEHAPHLLKVRGNLPVAGQTADNRRRG